MCQVYLEVLRGFELLSQEGELCLKKIHSILRTYSFLHQNLVAESSENDGLSFNDRYQLSKELLGKVRADRMGRVSRITRLRGGAQGTFGSVLRCTSKLDGKQYAIKIINLQTVDVHSVEKLHHGRVTHKPSIVLVPFTYHV